VFNNIVAKVDQNVSYIAMIAHVCCKRDVPNISSVFLDVCYKCVYLDVAYVFTHFCNLFYLNVVYICNGFQVFFQMFF
jgi:hypothetical protein